MKCISASYLCVCLILVSFNSPCLASPQPALFMFALTCWLWLECAGAGADLVPSPQRVPGAGMSDLKHYQEDLSDVFSFSSEVFCSLCIEETAMIQDTVQELQCHDTGLFCGQKYVCLKSLRLFTVSFDDVVF